MGANRAVLEKPASEGSPSVTRMNRSTTKALLAAGVVAGPLYVAVGLLEILIRPGFDITRHELSLMTLGSLGWIQVANFVVTGLLVIAASIGVRRVLHPGPGGTWGSLLLAIYGLGLIGAGIFVPDPMNGFPPGLATPARSAGTRS